MDVTHVMAENNILKVIRRSLVEFKYSPQEEELTWFIKVYLRNNTTQ